MFSVPVLVYYVGPLLENKLCHRQNLFPLKNIMLLLLISFHYATSLLGFRRTLITAQHHHVAIENTEIIILFTTSFTTLSHVEKNPTMLHFLRCRKGPDDIILSVISLAGQAMG